jgi:transcriptional regulator PpsR
VNYPDAFPQILSDMDPQTAASLIAAASDMALVIDPKGIIQDVKLSSDDLPLNDCRAWIGQPWSSTVTSESRGKVQDLIKDAGATTKRKWRHINYPSAEGADLPIMCSTIQVGSQGDIVAFGRDMRNAAALQQRLVQSHQSMERDYLRMRHMETRYRLLFELASEAVLIVDTHNNKILEANPAAAKILDIQVKRLIGKSLTDCIDGAHKPTVEELLSAVRNTGTPDSRKMAGSKDGVELVLSASIFKQENGSLFLVRLTPVSLHSSVQVLMPRRSMLLEVLEHSPDGFVVTDAAGKILTSNQAFVEMAQMMRPDQVIGQPLETWLGRSEVDLRVLISNIQQRGSVRLFATSLRGSNGAEFQVEISGVATQDSQRPCLGFSIRDIGQRAGAEREPLQELPRSADQLVELVGRVPLQEIVSETADLIEKLCIEAALKLTRDNRASASEMLGLSRQSLYVKLRRYGIGEVSDRNKK